MYNSRSNSHLRGNMINRNKQKSSKQLNIINPIFKSMEEYEDDPYWKTEFEKASQGRFPPKISFKSGIVYFTKTKTAKGKVSKKVLSSEIMTAIEEYKRFIHENTFNRSRVEVEEDNKLNEERMKNGKSIEDYEWKELKKRKIKEILILNFINNASQEMNLSEMEKYELNMLVNIGLINGRINSLTIIYEEGEIVGIKNLMRDSETGKIFLDTSIKPKNKKSRPQISVNLLDRWDKPSITGYDKLWNLYIEKYSETNITESEPSESKTYSSEMCDTE